MCTFAPGAPRGPPRGPHTPFLNKYIIYWPGWAPKWGPGGGPGGSPGPPAWGSRAPPGPGGRGGAPGSGPDRALPGYPFGGPADQCYKACPRWVNASGLAPDGSMHRGLPQRGIHHPTLSWLRCGWLSQPASPLRVVLLWMAMRSMVCLRHWRGGRTLRLNDLSINTDPIGWSPSCPCLGRVAPTLLLR